MSPEAIEIRAAAEALLAGIRLPDPTLPGSDAPAFRTVHRIPVEFEPDDDLPGLVVAITREQMQPDGDLGVGEVAFVNTATLTTYVTIEGNSREDCDRRLTTRTFAIMTTLLRDISFVSEHGIEGFSSVNEVRQFRKDGEGFFADARIEFGIQYRTQWAPVITDDLRHILMTTEPYGAVDHPPAIRTKIDLPAA